MKLVRLYTNQPKLFTPVKFNPGLSAVLAEIRLPENLDRDTHNLGKTTLGALIDFCLLKGKDKGFFLFKHENLFKSFKFFLEVELPAGGFLTIGRAVVPGSKVDFLRSASSVSDATGLDEETWDHYGVAFARAKTLLDGMLDFDALRPYPFRKLVGYLIRTQQDYQDVFQLNKFSGVHRDWKPFVAHLLGAQSGPIQDLYDKRAESEKAAEDLKVLLREWGPDESDTSLLDGLIAARRRTIAAKQETLERFNFRDEDQRTIAELVDRLDDRIVSLNDELYTLYKLRKRIDESLLSQHIAFSQTSAGKLFREAGVAFEGQLKKSFEQLIEFNREMTDERRAALVTQRADTENSIEAIEAELSELNDQRSTSLAFLRETDTLAKFKDMSRELTKLQSDLALLERQREAAGNLLELRRKGRALTQEVANLQTQIEDELDRLSKNEDSRFALIRRYFEEIVAAVIDEQAALSIALNDAGGVEFRAELMGSAGIATSGDKGTSYRKLLCIAFDLAVIRAYLDSPFPRFVYHDGALEQLDPRPRTNLIRVLREYAQIGVQPMISLLDSDLPEPLGTSNKTLSKRDVVLALHDEGEDGRLFKMSAW